MGATARAKISNAENAIAGMQKANDDLRTALQFLDMKEGRLKGADEDLRQIAAKKYPGVADLTPMLAHDQDLKRAWETLLKLRAEVPAAKTKLVQDYAFLQGSISVAKTALDELDALILKKKKKKDDAGGNLIKKLAAKTQTKSLGNLEAQKDAIDKAIEKVKSDTLAIKKYIEALD